MSRPACSGDVGSASARRPRACRAPLRAACRSACRCAGRARHRGVRRARTRRRRAPRSRSSCAGASGARARTSPAAAPRTPTPSAPARGTGCRAGTRPRLGEEISSTPSGPQDARQLRDGLALGGHVLDGLEARDDVEARVLERQSRDVTVFELECLAVPVCRARGRDRALVDVDPDAAPRARRGPPGAARRSPRRSRRRAPHGRRRRALPTGSGRGARPRPARPGTTPGRSARLAGPMARSKLWRSRDGVRSEGDFPQ